MTTRLVAYFRVSTAKQGASGLGLEAQRRAVEDYAKATGGVLLATYEEVESGKRDDRPSLTEALAYCKLTGARLVIAKLDRLSRDVHFLSGLTKAGVDFVACDMPSANTLTIHILAAVAEEERRAISIRTKAALACIKARLATGEGHVSRRSGQTITKLGSPRGLSVSRPDLGAAARIAKADNFASAMLDRIAALKASGLSLAGIAGKLNDAYIKSARGALWTPTAVKRVLDRAGLAGHASAPANW